MEFVINSMVSYSIGKVPFEIVYGYLPRTFPPIAFDEDNPSQGVPIPGPSGVLQSSHFSIHNKLGLIKGIDFQIPHEIRLYIL
jgi:hypothetical protein